MVPLSEDLRESIVLLPTLGERFLMLVVPIGATVLLSVWSANNLTPIYALADRTPSFFVADERGQGSGSGKFGAAVANAVAMVVLLVLSTFMILALYKYRLLGVVYGWLLLSAGSAFFVLAWIWLDLVFTFYQIPYEGVGAALLLWNVGVGGLVSVFYYAPPLFAQLYLVFISVILSWSLMALPEWTTWAILFLIAVYDIVAVLAPYGPLRLLLQAAAERREPLPGFIYNSASSAAPPSPPLRAHDTNANSGDQVTEQARVAKSARRAPVTPFTWMIVNARPFQLGIGDFVFYSLLVGKASTFGFMPWTFAFVAVVAGMIGTLVFLLVHKDAVRALPALPISIFLALAIFFLTRFAVSPLSFFINAHGLPL